jgi:hypothetical protein
VRRRIQAVRVVNVFLFSFLLFWVLSPGSSAQARVRKEIEIPGIKGFITLKCDFHMHTVFSDGEVWPPVRAEEAWRQGLDVIAITDHIEEKYLDHKEDVRPGQTDHNRSYELMLPRAQSLGLMLIKGGEITRDMPPGHFNAFFLRDTGLLDTPSFKDAIKAALDQGAFISWNHPPYPKGKSVWYKEHEELYQKGWMHGIEIVNGRDYYPTVHRWCLEKKLTMLGTSDTHAPIHLEYNFAQGEHRPFTLVFVKERTREALKEALFKRRTAVYWNKTLIGEEKFLKPIFENSIEILDPAVTIQGKKRKYIRIRNHSDIDFELEAEAGSEAVSFYKNLVIYGDRTVLLRISGKSGELSGKKKIVLPYRVKNLLIAPGKGLLVELEVHIHFLPGTKKN